MLQARLRRSRGAGEAGIGFALECGSRTGAALPRESDDTEVIPPSGRWALPRPLRDGRPPCANWRDDLRVVPCFRRDCAVCEEQVRRGSVLRSSAEAGQGRLRRESRTTRRSSLQVVDGRFALCYWLGMILGASSAMADSMRAVVVWRSLPPATKPSSTGALTIT